MPTTQELQNLADACKAAVASQKITGCPADLTVPQWILESGWGLRMPPGSNNPFGIKALPGQPSVAVPTQEFVDGVEGTYLQNFRAFDSLTDAFNSHGLLIATGKPYQAAFAQYEQDHNIVTLIKGVAARYATAPTYATQLLTLLQEKPVQQALVFAKIAAGVPA